MPNSGTIAVPDLVGLPQSAAAAKLNSAGLVVGTVTTVSSATVPTGNVSSASPPASTLVDAGSLVNMEVSIGAAGGAAQVAVPNVVGLTVPAAEAILKSAGLAVGSVKTQHSNSVPDGGISSINPDAGTMVSPGSAIQLDLSNGPEPNWTQYIPTGLLALLGIIILGLIVYGITQKDQKFLTNLANKEVARGLITFLIAIATVGIAIILAISTLVLTEGDAGDSHWS
jgi:beta-lactam-binding protein with PASTA domain